MRKTILFVASCLCLAGPLWAGNVVGSRFIIVDEIYDMERLSGGTVAFRGYDFNIVLGQPVDTQATLLFAMDGGGLSASDAANGTARCMNGDYLMVADAALGIASTGKPAIIDLGGVLFSTVNGKTALRGGSGCNSCANACSTSWWCRLKTFKDHAAGELNASTVLFFTLFAETTGSGITDSDLTTAAQQVKAFFPGVKVGAGYPTTGSLWNQIPASFVSSLDVIVTWDYGIANANVPPYSNSTNLYDSTTRYGRVADAALSGGQGIYFLVSGFNQPAVLGAGSEIDDWPGNGDSFSALIRNWCPLSFKRNQAVDSGLIVWKYNDSFSCATGTCGGNPPCSGVVRTQSGANQTFSYEASIRSTALARSYVAMSQAAQFNGSCSAP